REPALRTEHPALRRSATPRERGTFRELEGWLLRCGSASSCPEPQWKQLLSQVPFLLLWASLWRQSARKQRCHADLRTTAANGNSKWAVIAELRAAPNGRCGSR